MKAPVAIALAFAAVAAGVVTWQSFGADGYTYTFDGAPGAPQSMYWMDDFDVQVHTGNMHNVNDPNSMNYKDPDVVPLQEGHHGPNCEPPGSDGSVRHNIDTATESVYQCHNHVMTAIHAGYALIYLTPDRMLDWSDGEATLSVDVSTRATVGRDWWDMWLTPWENQSAVPLGFPAEGVDLSGPPPNDWLHVTMNFGEKWFRAFSDNGDVPSGGPAYAASSATQRDTFELTINATTFSFCKPDEGICWVNDQPHGLSTTQAVFQLGHHAYSPTKDDCGGCYQPNTWHWDNLSMSDSVPFTIIRADKRSVYKPWWSNSDAERTVNFDAPAPANSLLRFTGKVPAGGKVFVNGAEVAPLVPAFNEHATSYLVPIAEGTQRVVFNFQGGPGGDCNCIAKDFSIVSKSTAAAPTPTPVPPTDTPEPTAIPTSTSTATAVPPTDTPIPTNTPEPEPTATFTAEPTATATEIPTATPEPADVCHQALFRNGVLEAGPEIACP